MIRVTATLVLIVSATAAAHAGAVYQTGGSQPLAPAQQEILNRHAAILSLGINTDWIAEANVDTESFVAAIDMVATAAKAGSIPGAVIYVDRLDQTMMPVAIGWQMTEPEQRLLTYDTRYDLDEMTGVIITAPMAVSAITTGELKPEDTIGSRLPQVTNPVLAKVTIAQLLEHRSGLRALPPLTTPFATEEAFWQGVNELPFDSQPGEQRGIANTNFLMLSLIVDTLDPKTFREQATESVIDHFGLGVAALGIDSDKRFTLAPAEFDAGRGHLLWGDPPDAYAAWLGRNSGHSGLIAPADDVAGMLRGWLAMASAVRGLPPGSLPPMARSFMAPAGSDTWVFAPTGDGGFGWDSPRGCSIRVLPDRGGLIAYLSNPAHPSGVNPSTDPRPRVMPLLISSLKPPTTPTP